MPFSLTFASIYSTIKLKINHMKFFTPIKITALAIGCLAGSLAMHSQTTLYLENFDASATSLPTGWATTTGGWEVSASNSSTVVAGASGVNSVKIDNSNAATGTYSLTTSPVSTTGYTNIGISWLARLTTNFPPSTINPYLYYSTNNGTTWTGVSYTEMSSASTWTLNSGITLPAAANNQASVIFQLVANITHATSGTYRIDDFKVTGTATTTGIEESNASAPKIYAYNKVAYIQLDAAANAEGSEMIIYSAEGKELVRKQLSQASTQFDMSAFAAGIYFVKIQSAGNALVTQKIMVN